jgi:hypothetical protein
VIVLKDIPIELDPQRIAVALNHGRPSESVAEDVEEAIRAARPFWRPAAVAQWCKVESRDGERVTVRSEASARTVELRMGRRAGLVDPARRALVSVATIGAEFDRKATEMERSGDGFLWYYLPNVGTAALAEVSEALCRLAEREAAERGWGTGLRLAPGSLEGWDVADQARLCSLLPLDEIGVHLDEDGVLHPYYSTTGFIPVGPDYSATTVGSACRFCRRAPDCWRRRLD